MIRVMVSGVLYGRPQARTAASGKGFATAKVRGDGKDGTTTWCSIIAFGEIADRLLTLGDGAALSVSGRAEINAWLDKAGEPKAGLSLLVDDLVTLKAKPKPQGGEQGEPAPRQSPRRPVATAPSFDDALPDFM